MCILHLKSRCTETDSEQVLLDLCYTICLVINFWLSKGGAPPISHLGETLLCMCALERLLE